MFSNHPAHRILSNVLLTVHFMSELSALMLIFMFYQDAGLEIAASFFMTKQSVIQPSEVKVEMRTLNSER